MKPSRHVLEDVMPTRLISFLGDKLLIGPSPTFLGPDDYPSCFLLRDLNLGFDKDSFHAILKVRVGVFSAITFEEATNS